MKALLATFILLAAFGITRGQDVCPSGNVCLPQAQANRLLEAVNQLIEAKDVIAKMKVERGQADAVIASAQRVIEDYKSLDQINGMMIVKFKDVIALYEKTLTMYQGLVEKLEKQLNAPKSAWKKFVGILGKAVIMLAGVTLGRGL
jgi:hypothetical protein